MIARIGMRLLASIGYEVTIATTSQEALLLFSSDPKSFDLVITDQTMPGMTGARLARAMLEVKPELPIILCTGYSELIDRAGTSAIGIRGFLEKPFSLGTLAHLIRSILANHE